MVSSTDDYREGAIALVPHVCGADGKSDGDVIACDVIASKSIPYWIVDTCAAP